MDLSFLHKLPSVTLEAGQVLITEGQQIGCLYYLESGEVDVLKNDTLIAQVFERGAVFGDMAYLMESAPTATIRATTACVFRHVPDPAAFFREHPEMTLHLAMVLARRLDSLNRYLVEIKQQFKDRADHLGMIDEVLDALMNKHPRKLVRREAGIEGAAPEHIK